MKFAIYLPPEAENQLCPVLYYLSGLTCTEQNFIQKAGAQKYASKYGLIIVACDTSPRTVQVQLSSATTINFNILFTKYVILWLGGCNISGENDKWNYGTGAGYYVNAREEPWNKHYRMYSYITDELPTLIKENFPVLADKQSIMGHRYVLPDWCPI